MNLDEAKGVLYRAAADDVMAAVDDHRPFVSREVQEQAARDILGADPDIIEALEGLAWDEGLSEDGRRHMVLTVIATVKAQAVQAMNEYYGLNIPLDVGEWPRGPGAGSSAG